MIHVKNRGFLLSLMIFACSQLHLIQGCQQGELLRYMPRVGWEARSPKAVLENQTLPVHRVFIHHTETPSCYNELECSRIVRSVQNYHMNQGFDDIGYTFLIGGDGMIYEGRPVNKVGAHAKHFNEDSIGIAFIGNFTARLPQEKMYNVAKNLISCGVTLFNLIAEDYTLHGHKDARRTDCPGLIYDDIKEWDRFQAGPLPGYN